MISLKTLKFPIVIILCIAILPIVSFAQVSLTGEFRPRTELRDGYRILNTDESEAAFFVSQRTRLNFLYEGNSYLLKISGQDVRTWGEVEQLGDTPNVNIHEAWAQIDLTELLQVKLGRQELVYDDQRLLGSVNWAQQARSHDALLIQHRNPASTFKIDIGAAYNQERENLQGNSYTLNNYKVLSFAWLKKEIESLDISGLVLADGFETLTGAVNYRYTLGSLLNYHKENWSTSASGYLQRGDDATRKSISAYMLAAQASYKWSAITITGGIDYLSGGKAGNSNPSNGAFHTLYATNHKFYGAMDYFLNIPADTRGGGLQDLFLTTNYTASPKVALGIGLHHFSLAEDILNPASLSETLSRNLATEADLSITYKMEEELTFRLGYSLLFPSSTIESLQLRDSGGLQQWGWAMLVLNPKIL